MTAALAILFVGYSTSWGQNEVTMPVGLHQHGKNSADVTTAIENTDSITVGSAMRYWAEADASVANPLNTYAWTITPAALGSQTAGSPTNLATITFGAAPTIGTIQVIETSSNGCAGSARIIDVQTIAAPNVTGSTFSAISCPTGIPPYTVAGPTATLTIASSVSGAKQVVVNYNLTGPAGFVALNNQTANLGNGNQINLTGVNLNQPGTYTLHINTVVDRISVKSGVTTTVNADYTFVLNRAPVTGPIYHLPNN